MADFLLELRSEEIPARMQDKARDDLARLFTAELEKTGLKTDAIVTFATPRRLALIARDLPAETAAVSEEVKGPRVGAPPQALEGFLRKTGLTADQLVERDGVLYAVIDKPGRRTADVLAEAIPAIVRAFPWPKSMRWGEASTSTESLRWVRPLHGIVALLGEDIVPCEIAGVRSGAATVGHRFHRPGVITIGSAADYAEKLHACHVIVDQDERRAIIALGATMAARKAGLELVQDEGLLTENAGLTEWPVPLLGRFDAEFLAVPPEVIQLTARVNQKYFVCRDASGKLANAFVCTANIDAADGGAKIVEGNRKVLAARLSDARFFYDTDLKVPLEEQAKKLEKIVFHEKLGTVADKVERVAKLARWLVEEGIVKSPSPLVGEGRGPLASASGKDEGDSPLTPPHPSEPRNKSGPLPPSPTRGEGNLADHAERAARLAKADLVTGMVGEFPELQGLMGGYYAAAQGEDAAVADAVRDHYKPVGQGDDVPTAPVTVAVSLADKLDSLCVFFADDELPSGSKDPYALRRSTIAVIRLLVENDIRLNLSRVVFVVSDLIPLMKIRRGLVERQLFPAAVKSLSDKMFKGREASLEQISTLPNGHVELTIRTSNGEVGRTTIAQKSVLDMWFGLNRVTHFLETGGATLVEFFADRLKVQQREAGVRHDLIDAVFALGGEDDLVRLLARVRALQSFIATEDGANLVSGYKRAAKIVAQTSNQVKIVRPPEDPGGVRETALELSLQSAVAAAEPEVARAVESENFEEAMRILSSLRQPIDHFMDGVLVFHPDADVAARRLDLLRRFRDAVHTVADFSKIEG
ncbi:MAG: glycine--tRNA ligase subunit beta [Sphingomonas sp.]